MNTAKAKTKVFQIHSGIVVLSMVLIMGFNGCESAFEPLQGHDLNYSINGYLDLHSNEHWFRVNPIRQQVIAGADWDSLVVDVIFTREQTRESTELEGHLFTFFEDGEDTSNFWNYVLMDSLNPNEEYTIRVTGEEGQSSYATVRMPETYPKPVVDSFNEDLFQGLITGTVNNRIVLATLEYNISVNGRCCLYYTAPKLKEGEVDVDENGNFRIYINDRQNIDKAFPRVPVAEMDIAQVILIFAVDNGSWPYSSNAGSEENAIPDAQRNVQDGLGVVTGLASYTIRVDPCQLPDGSECPVLDLKTESETIFKYLEN